MSKKTRVDIVMDELLRVSGNKYAYDKILTGYRLTLVDGKRGVSPRLPRKQFIAWIEAFLAGYEDGHVSGYAQAQMNGT